MIRWLLQVLRGDRERYQLELAHPRSSKWPEVRKEWLRANPTCAACGTAKNCTVHHVQPFHLFPELELSDTNFITLCESMLFHEDHLKFGHTVNGKSSWSINNPNVRADAAANLDKVQELQLLKYGTLTPQPWWRMWI